MTLIAKYVKSIECRFVEIRLTGYELPTRLMKPVSIIRNERKSERRSFECTSRYVSWFSVKERGIGGVERGGETRPRKEGGCIRGKDIGSHLLLFINSRRSERHPFCTFGNSFHIRPLFHTRTLVHKKHIKCNALYPLCVCIHIYIYIL